MIHLSYSIDSITRDAQRYTSTQLIPSGSYRNKSRATETANTVGVSPQGLGADCCTQSKQSSSQNNHVAASGMLQLLPASASLPQWMYVYNSTGAQFVLADELGIPCICMGDFNSVASLDLDVWCGSHVLRPSA